MNQIVTRFFGFSFLLGALISCGSTDARLVATSTNSSVSTATQSFTQESTVTPTTTLELVQSTVAMTATPTMLAATLQPTLPLPTFTPPATPSPFALEMTEELTFNLLNQQGGAIRSVAVVGQTAVVGAGPRLVVVDITNPTEPQTLGQSEVLPGLVQAVLVRDGLAYVGAGSFITILDVSQPQSPTLLAALPLPEPVLHLALSTETLIAATSSFPANPQEIGSGTIVTIDVSQSTHPQLLDSVTLPWYINAFAMANEIVYASNPAEELFFAVDTSRPDDLPEPVAFPIDTLTYGLQAQGQTLYVSGGRSNVMAWDVSTLTEPHLLWEVSAEPDPNFGAGVVYGFVLAENRAYLNAVGYEGGQIGLLSLPLPEPIEKEVDDLVTSEIVIQDDQILIAQASLDLYRINDGEDILLQTCYHIPGIFLGPNDIAFAGRNGLIISQGGATDSENGRLSIIQLPLLNLVGDYVNERSCKSCDTYLANVAVVDDLAYTTGGDGSLRIFDISDPAQPILVATYTPLDLGSSWQRIYDLSVVAERGYAVGYAGNRTVSLAFDLSDAHHVQVDSKTYWIGSAERVTATETEVYLYTMLFTDQTTYELRHFTRNDGELTLIGSVEVSSQIYDLIPYGDVVLAATADGLMIVSTDTATGQPQIIAQAQIPGGLWEMALMDDVLLATTAESFGNGRLLAIDLQDLTRPRLIGATSLPAGKAELAATDEGAILLGNEAMGLMVFETSYK